MSIDQPSPTKPPGKYRFTLKQMLLTITVLGIALAVWVAWFRTEVVVRAPDPDELIAERYLGFYPDNLQARNIAVITGRFRKDTVLSVRLLVVQRGVVDQGNGFTVGRTRNWVGDSYLESMRLRFALGEQTTRAGKEIALGCIGHTWGSGNDGTVPCNFKTVTTKLQPAKIRPGEWQIIYVEGDRPIVLLREMSVPDFVKTNPGNYLVVVAKLN